MTTTVFVTRLSDNRYTARALAFSDVIASGTSESEAISALRLALADLQARSHIVEVDLPVPAASVDDPWLRAAGIWAEDPSWEEFQQAISETRNQRDFGLVPGLSIEDWSVPPGPE